MNIFRKLLLVSVVLILGCGLAFALNVDFTVEVTDGNTGTPVKGADVSLAGTGGGRAIHQTTSTDGLATFPSIPVGEYTLVVVADGYTTHSEVITIDANRRRRQIAVF